MPTLTIPNTFSPNTVAQSAQVNANFNAVATLVNSTKLDSDNIQTGGILTASLADDSVTKAKINADIAGAGLAQAVDGALDITVDGSTIEIISDSLRVRDGGITRPKLVAVGQVITPGAINANISSGSLTNVSGLAVTINTTGRPVVISCQGDAGGGASFEWNHSGTVQIALTRNGTVIANYRLGCGAGGSQNAAPSAMSCLDIVGAGSQTYQVQVSTTVSNIVINNMLLVAREL